MVNIDSDLFQWYACYTKAKSERSAITRLERVGVTCYLPLKKERRKWSDRLKVIETPLFNSYIFVHIKQSEFHKVRLEGEIVRFITFEGKPVPIPQEQIDIIKQLLSSGTEIEVAPSGMKPGQKIIVVSGPLLGIKGELIRHQGTHRVLIRLDEIGQGLLITVDSDNIGSDL